MGIIEFKDVSFQYPNGFSAVENVSFEINKGDFFYIPSGTLHAICSGS